MNHQEFDQAPGWQERGRAWAAGKSDRAFNINTVDVKVPKVFFDDHVDRDLATRELIVDENAAHYTIRLNQEAFNELRSDAHYYSAAWQFDPGCFGLCSSARATARRLADADTPAEWEVAI